MTRAPSRLDSATLLALLVAALAVVAPFTVRGVACGHDLGFHLNGWMEVEQQWKEGTLYPRWAPNANYGSGEPRFLFYPPLSWLLGGVLGSFVPWLFVPVAFDICAVVLAGLAMHRMAREWFPAFQARLIAVAYAINPYMLLSIYARSAFAEMLAAAFFPLLVLWIVREQPARRMFVPLAVTLAGVWLTNVPAAILASYVSALLLVVMTIARRNSRLFLYGAGAMALGVALASFYIVPVLYEKSWITVGQLLAAGVRPDENFLFAHTGEFEHDQFLRAVSWLATAEILVTALSIVAARWWRRQHARLWFSLVILALLSLLLMLPVAAIAYRLMPDLRFLQFPWRWLLVVGPPYAVAIVASVPPFRGRAAAYVLLFAALIACCNRALQPQCDPAETPFMISNEFRTGYGYMGTDEYVPAGGDNYEIKADFPEYRFRGENGGPPPAAARVTHWHDTTYRKRLTVESPAPLAIVLRLMNYPAWRVTVNKVLAAVESDDPTGRMVIRLPAGHSEIEVRFVRTPDRSIGDGFSLAALVVLAAFWYVERRKGISPQRQAETG